MEWIGPTVLKNQLVWDFRHSFLWLQPKLALYKCCYLILTCTVTFMLWRILVVKSVASLFFYSLPRLIVLPQNTLTGSLIFIFFVYLLAPKKWLAVCGLVYLVYLFFSYLSHALLDFSETGTTFYLMHNLQVQRFPDNYGTAHVQVYKKNMCDASCLEKFWR